MDKVAKGMTEAGRRAAGKPPLAEEKSSGISAKLKEGAQRTAEKIGQGMESMGQKLKDAAR